MTAKRSFNKTGTSAVSRSLPALNPQWIKVDERDLSTLMAHTLEYAKVVDYVNET